MPAVGYVCTNYNNAPVTRAAVASLYADNAPDRVRVVVVDNASHDADRAALGRLADEFRGVDVVYNAENVGYFPGLNIGIERLRGLRSDCDLMVVGNNDLEFPQGFVANVVRNREVLDRWAVVAPDLVSPEGQHQNPHVLRPISRLRRAVWDVHFSSRAAASLVRLAARATRRLTTRAENAPESTLHLTPGPIEQGYGACYLLGPAFFRHFSQLCAPTFLMQEEFFLSEQLATIGQQTWYDPRFVVLHRHHATMGAIPGRRHWEISRASHLVYKRYLAMSSAERQAFISQHSRKTA